MLPSTFRQIEVFLAVVEAGSFAGAAAKLSITSASVSNHIKALERQMGQELFVRQRGRRVVLAEAGRRVYARGLALMEQVNLLSRELAPNRVSGRRRLTIASQRFLARVFLAPAVAEFSGANPDIELMVDTGNYEHVIETIRAGRADLAYVMAFGRQIDLPSTVIAEERLGFFAGPGHPAVAAQPLDVAQLASYGFYTTKRSERFGHMIATAMASIGLSDVRIVSQIQDGAMIGELVSRGGGLMCGPVRYVADQVQAGRLVELQVDCPPLRVQVHQIRAAGRHSDPLVADFSRHLQSHIAV